MSIESRNFYKELKEICDQLISKVINIPTKTGFISTSWFSSLEYNKEDGTLEVVSDRKLIPYLLELKEYFTKYRLWNTIRLNSSYSIRIYELLKQYEHIGRRDITIEELREILGIARDKYVLYSNFKNKVIIPAQKELKKSTDIKFEFTEKKLARKVHSITFKIKTNNDYDKQIIFEDYYNTEELEQKRIDKVYWFKNELYIDNKNFNKEELEKIFTRLEINITETIKEYLTDEQLDRFYIMQEAIVKMFLSKAYRKKIKILNSLDLIQAYDLTINKIGIFDKVAYMERILINKADNRNFNGLN